MIIMIPKTIMPSPLAQERSHETYMLLHIVILHWFINFMVGVAALRVEKLLYSLPLSSGLHTRSSLPSP